MLRQHVRVGQTSEVSGVVDSTELFYTFLDGSLDVFFLCHVGVDGKTLRPVLFYSCFSCRESRFVLNVDECNAFGSFGTLSAGW